MKTKQINRYTLDKLIITSSSQEEWDKVLELLKENGVECYGISDYYKKEEYGYSILLRNEKPAGRCEYIGYKKDENYQDCLFITAHEFLKGNHLWTTSDIDKMYREPTTDFRDGDIVFMDKDGKYKKVEDNKQSNKKNIMSNILNKVKNLTLSKNDRLLREYDFQDNCGNFTQSARDVVIEKLVEDNKEYLIEVATKLKKEDKED